MIGRLADGRSRRCAWRAARSDLFISNGFDVVIAGSWRARKAQRELQRGGASVLAVDVDLATREGCDQLCEEVRALGRPIDALALDAGGRVNGAFLETDLEAELRMIDLKCATVGRLAKQLLPDMALRGKGRV